MELIIRTENQDNFDWFKKALGDQYQYTYRNIPIPDNLSGPTSKTDSEFHNLPKRLKDLLKFDKTDFIISAILHEVETPIISLEITKSAPLSQHIEQRMARMISAAELGIVPIFICPNKLKKEKGGFYKFSNKYYDLYRRIGSINRLPCVIFNYPDSEGILINDNEYPECPAIDNSNITHSFNFIKEVLSEVKNFENMDFNFFNNKKIKKVFTDQHLLSKDKKYDIEKMGTCQLIETRDLFSYLKNYSNKDENWIKKTFDQISNKIKQRKKSLIFFPGNAKKLEDSRLFAHSGDPYVGMLSALDYAFCRTGRTVDDRNINLIYIPGNEDDSDFEKVFAPEGFNKFYEKDCPFKLSKIDENIDVGVSQQVKISHHLQYGCTYTKIRPLKIYAHYCDLIIFKNAVLTF